MPRDKEGRRVMQMDCAGFAKTWSTKVKIVVNGWCSQALGGHERSHDDDSRKLGSGMGLRTRTEEVLERRSVFAAKEPTWIWIESTETELSQLEILREPV